MAALAVFLLCTSRASPLLVESASGIMSQKVSAPAVLPGKQRIGKRLTMLVA
jgi:hypothetical protein